MIPVLPPLYAITRDVFTSKTSSSTLIRVWLAHTRLAQQLYAYQQNSYLATRQGCVSHAYAPWVVPPYAYGHAIYVYGQFPYISTRDSHDRSIFPSNFISATVPVSTIQIITTQQFHNITYSSIYTLTCD